MSLETGILEFVAVCAACAFVCTALKEDEDPRLSRNSLRLFCFLAGGIVVFGLGVQALTWWA